MLTGCKLEPSLGGSRGGRAATSSSGWATSASIRIRRPASLVFNRTVALRDTWAKIEKRGKGRTSDHSRNRRHPGRCRQRHSARTANWWPPSKNRSWCGGARIGAAAASCRSNPSPRAWNWRAPRPEQVDAVAVVRPVPESDFAPEAARAVSRQPHRGGGAPPGARRLGLLPFPVRRGHGADARPRRRFPLRLALAGARRADDARTGAVLARFARRSLRPRHRTAGLRRQRGRAQGAVAFGARRRALPRPVPGDPERVGDAGPRLDRSFFSTERLHARRFRRAVLRAAGAARRRAPSRRRCARTSRPACRRPWKTAVHPHGRRGRATCAWRAAWG